LETGEAKRAAASRASLPELQNDLNSLAKKWQEAETFGRPLDQEFLARCQQHSDWLQSRIRHRLKRKRILAASAALFVLAALAAVGFFLWDFIQEKQIVAQLAGFESPAERRVGETERLLAQTSARYKTKPRVADAIAMAE